MPLEDIEGAGKYLGSLVSSNPASPDDRREGDNHIRGVKNVLKNTFPNINAAVLATAAEIDRVLTGSFASLAVAGNATVGGSLGVTGSSGFYGVLEVYSNVVNFRANAPYELVQTTNNALRFYTNNLLRMELPAAGGMSIPAPTGGGGALTVDGAVTLASQEHGGVQLNFGQGAGTGFYVQHRNGPASAGIDGDLVQETVLDFAQSTRNAAIQWRRGGSVTGGFLTFTAGNDRGMMQIRDTGVSIFAPVSGTALAVFNPASQDAIRVRGLSGASGNLVVQADAGLGSAFWVTATTTILKIGATGGSEPAAAPLQINNIGGVALTGNVTLDASASPGIGLAITAAGGPGVDVLLNNETFGRVLNGRNFSAGGANQAQILQNGGEAWFGNDRAGETVLFTAATRRLTIGSAGGVTIVEPSAGPALVLGDKVAGRDPGAAFTAIPIGGIAGGNYSGAGFTAVGPGGTLAFDGSNFITAIGPNSSTVAIQYGTWRSLGQQSAGYGMWMRIG